MCLCVSKKSVNCVLKHPKNFKKIKTNHLFPSLHVQLSNQQKCGTLRVYV
jgi:hypothetical protein